MMLAKIINIEIERGEAGLFHATSQDLRGLLVSGESVEEVREALPVVVAAMYSAHGEAVRVVEAESSNSAPAPWVVLPEAALDVAC